MDLVNNIKVEKNLVDNNFNAFIVLERLTEEDIKRVTKTLVQLSKIYIVC